MKNLDSFDKNCSNIFNKYLDTFNKGKRTADKIRDKPFNLEMSSRLVNSLTDELLKLSNTEVEQHQTDKEAVTVIAQKYIKDFLATTVKLS